jgi:NTE family protein
VHPAGFVRASMAIPIFFESYFIDEIPCRDPIIVKLWRDTLGIDNNIPSTARFVDGGVLSNFPLNLFFNPDVVIPRLPAFGIDLDDEKMPEEANADNPVVDDTSNSPQSWSFGGYLYRIFNTVRFYYDKDFLIKNIFFKKGIGIVPLKGYNWLNFFMSNEQKKEMFLLGAKAAAEFLKNFDWESYKQERVKMFNKIKP